jgi:hypothetical protein
MVPATGAWLYWLKDFGQGQDAGTAEPIEDFAGGNLMH